MLPFFDLQVWCACQIQRWSRLLIKLTPTLPKILSLNGCTQVKAPFPNCNNSFGTKKMTYGDIWSKKWDAIT